MIELNDRYRMTSEAEKAMIRLGGADPDKTLTEAELSEALQEAIRLLGEHGKFHILEKLYLAGVRNGDFPDLRDQ